MMIALHEKMPRSFQCSTRRPILLSLLVFFFLTYAPPLALAAHNPSARSDAITVHNDGTEKTLNVFIANPTNADSDGQGHAFWITAGAITPDNGGAAVRNAAKNRILYTPALGFAGTEKFTYFIKCSDDKTDDAEVTVTVTNAAPVAANDTASVDFSSGGTTISVLGNDTDADDASNTLTVAAVTQPAAGTGSVTKNATDVTYLPPVGFTGSTSFTYTVKDPGGRTSNSATVTVTVTNTAPVAANDTASVAKNSGGTTIDVLANDSDPNDAQNTLTVSAVTQPAQGSVVNNTTNVSYTPPNGYVGITSFTYTVRDPSGLTSTATVTVTVGALSAVNDTYTVAKNSGTTVLTPSVLDNDSDPDGGIASAAFTITSINTNNTLGTVTQNGNILSYNPNAFIGTEQFSYTISVADGRTATAIVTMVVTSINHAPQAVDDAFTVNRNSGANIFDVLANDTDTDADDTKAIQSVTQPGSGVASNNNSTITYTPPVAYSGTTTFTYTMQDSGGLTSTATVTITVDNAAPVASNDTASITKNSSNNVINVLANDTDANSDSLTVSALTQPGSGSVTNNTNNVLYTPVNGFTGTTSFTYTVQDSGGLTSTAAVDVTVSAAVDLPLALPTYTMGDFTLDPINMTESVAPLVMIATSNDHQHFFKAYDDYSDLDNDGEIDTSYKHSVDYYGYFDSYKCYGYNNASAPTEKLRYVPKAVTADKYCTGANDDYWSGNFLNWATMARIDTSRKMLFGGHRRVDTAAETVLERTYLPHDAHSWAKHYNGADLDKLTPFSTTQVAPYKYIASDADDKKEGITICNTTDVANTNTFSHNVTDPPLMKVVQGNYSLWAANERWQCTWDSGSASDNHPASNGNNSALSGIDAYSSSPVYGAAGLGDKNYVVRVQACVSGLIGEEKCKQYPSGNYKPIGLLQVYGDDDRLIFGMIGGSYGGHDAGGILLNDIQSLSTEVNVATDGTFKQVATFAGGPMANNKADGSINAWSLWRIFGYNHSDGTYNSNQGDNCSWGLSAKADVTGTNKCTNWGNPFAEIYLQSLRYISAAGVAGVFQFNDSTSIAGLNTPQVWKDPLSQTNYCARINVVALNNSIISYDNDQLDGNSYGVKDVWNPADLPGAMTAAAMTDVVGAGEGLHGNSYFVGELAVDTAGDADDQLCTAKAINSFGNAGGQCPDAPRLSGSYRLDGLAYYAHTKDIRSDALTGQRPMDGMQKVETYAVSAATAVPKLVIKHPLTGEDAVTLMPACRDRWSNDAQAPGNCAVVDFKVVSQTQNNAGGVNGVGTGRLAVNWEDSEQGGDYDQDMWGIINYTIDDNTNTITITTDVIGKSTPYRMGFGYIISGTTQDGFHTHSGINGFSYTDSATIFSGNSCSGGCNDTDAASAARYTLGTSAAKLLEDPLWYAAKWGGFQDSNSNNLPDLQSEWDKENNATGATTPDNIPDNYFFASNPAQLEDSLNRVFLAILQRVSSGTAAAVVSNNVSGEGALYQAYFEPKKQDADGNEATWFGTIQGLWLDSYGYLRQDDGDQTLEGYQTDKVVEMWFDDAAERTRIKIWESSTDDQYTSNGYNVGELNDLGTLWSAREQMYFSSLVDNDLIVQRSYTTSAANGRYVNTWIDDNHNGVIDTGEYQDFSAANISATDRGFFGQSTEADTDNLVNYLRGVEMSGYRNRTLDYDGDGTEEVMRLGDIVNSTPTVVGRPAEAFNLLYKDSSYAAFRQQYANRRNVLYAGANDGMLHAINAGFFDTHAVQYTPVGEKYDGADAVEHPLGSELWAYVPMNLLSHLQWLKRQDYAHVYFVDGKPKVFDARIFNTSNPDSTHWGDDDHPGGWGTVMVVGMRLGGSPMVVDTGADGYHQGIGDANDQYLRSAYMIFDITNPEAAPALLAEFQVPDGSYTTVYPSIMAFVSLADIDRDGVNDDSDFNKWYMAFGSGPTSAVTADSSSSAKLHILDLSDMATITTIDTGVASTFVAAPITVDWDIDFKADVVYFGLTGTSSATDGYLMRLAVDEDSDPSHWASKVSTVLNSERPITAPPTVAIDDATPPNQWVFIGTGRLYSTTDQSSKDQEYLFGVKDSYVAGDPAPAAITVNNLLDMTDVKVYTDGSIDPGANVDGPIGITTFSDLKTAIAASWDGWYIRLPPITGVAGAVPATRSLTQSSLAGSVLFTSVYQPNSDPCVSEGFGRLYGLYYQTGTSYPSENSILGTADVLVNGEEKKEALTYVDLGKGYATSPALHSGSGEGDKKVSVFTQLSTGTIFRKQAETVDSVRSGKRAWREVQ